MSQVSAPKSNPIPRQFIKKKSNFTKKTNLFSGGGGHRGVGTGSNTGGLSTGYLLRYGESKGSFGSGTEPPLPLVSFFSEEGAS